MEQPPSGVDQVAGGGHVGVHVDDSALEARVQRVRDAFVLMPSALAVVESLARRERSDATRKLAQEFLQRVSGCQKVLDELPGLHLTQEEQILMYLELKETLARKRALVAKYNLLDSEQEPELGSRAIADASAARVDENGEQVPVAAGGDGGGVDGGDGDDRRPEKRRNVT